MIRNKVVWDKHYYSNRFTVRNIFLLRYSRFRLICIFKSLLKERSFIKHIVAAFRGMHMSPSKHSYA